MFNNNNINIKNTYDSCFWYPSDCYFVFQLTKVNLDNEKSIKTLQEALAKTSELLDQAHESIYAKNACIKRLVTEIKKRDAKYDEFKSQVRGFYKTKVNKIK